MDKEDFAKQVIAAEATLYHISKTILKNDWDCADAVQEAIVTAYSKLPSLKEDRFFKTWLCRILINQCYQIYRANQKVVPLEDHMETAPPSAQQNLGLLDAIMGLKAALRMVIVLHHVEGFPIAETASILKIPEGTVKSRLFRARAELRPILGEKEDLFDES